MTKNTLYKEYAFMRGKIINWDDFLVENPWAAVEREAVPDHCVAVYYVVDQEQQKVSERLYLITYDAKYQPQFKDLTLTWVSENFVVEEYDLKQVNTPEEAIIQPGGEIFLLLNSADVVVGIVCTVIHNGSCELAKMTVNKEYTGRGYAHILMREAIGWAKDNNYPFIELYSTQILENAISIYKKYGFVTTHLGPHPAYARCDIIMRLAF